MNENESQMLRSKESPNCAKCSGLLGEPHTFCGNCNEHYCLDCGTAHFCTPTCPANGCIAGLCVRVVRDGELSRQWGVPREMIEPVG